MKFLKIALILAVAASMAGCCFCKKYQRLYGKPLQGTPWTLVQLDGRPVERYYLLTLDADKGLSVSGFEELTASYAYNRQGMMEITRLRPLDSSLAATLASADGYQLDGPFMMLTKDGEQIALFEAKGPQPISAGPAPLP